MSDRPNFAGMTVNERLFEVGITDKFDQAVRQRNRAKMIGLLQQVEVSDPEFTVDALLTNPGRYGY